MEIKLLLSTKDFERDLTVPKACDDIEVYILAREKSAKQRL